MKPLPKLFLGEKGVIKDPAAMGVPSARTPLVIGVSDWVLGDIW